MPVRVYVCLSRPTQSPSAARGSNNTGAPPVQMQHGPCGLDGSKVEGHLLLPLRHGRPRPAEPQHPSPHVRPGRQQQPCHGRRFGRVRGEVVVVAVVECAREALGQRRHHHHECGHVERVAHIRRGATLSCMGGMVARV